MTELRVGNLLGRAGDNNLVPTTHPEWREDLVWRDGFCAGEFGRDSYELKRVEVIGADYVVVRTLDSRRPEFYAGDPNDLVEHILPEGADDGD